MPENNSGQQTSGTAVLDPEVETPATPAKKQTAKKAAAKKKKTATKEFPGRVRRLCHPDERTIACEWKEHYDSAPEIRLYDVASRKWTTALTTGERKMYEPSIAMSPNGFVAIVNRGTLEVLNFYALKGRQCDCNSAVQAHFDEVLAGVYPPEAHE